MLYPLSSSVTHSHTLACTSTCARWTTGYHMHWRGQLTRSLAGWSTSLALTPSVPRPLTGTRLHPTLTHTHSPQTLTLTLTSAHPLTHAHTCWRLGAQPRLFPRWPHLPSGPGSRRPQATAAASREGRWRGSLAGQPRLSHAWEHAFLSREETALESTGTCPGWRRTHL